MDDQAEARRLLAPDHGLADALGVDEATPDESQWTVPFTAKLAPLGVPSDDGRTLSDRRPWTVRPGGVPVYLAVPEGRHIVPRVVGRVESVVSDGGELLADGFVEPDIARDLGDLFPEVDLNPAGWHQPAPDAPGVLVLDGGTVVAVRLGQLPAFPGLWIRVTDPETEG